LGFRVQDLGVQVSGSRVQGVELRVEGLVLSVECLKFRVQGECRGVGGHAPENARQKSHREPSPPLRIQEQLLSRNVGRFWGGLVFKAHR
jgi:hypothetical protein